MKKGIAVLLALLLLLSLVGCGAKGEMAASDMAMEVPAEEPAMPETEYGGWDAVTEEAVESPEAESGGGAEPDATLTEKIIYSASLSAETTEFDAAIAAIESMIAESGGYIQSSNVSGDTRYNDDGTTSVVNRYASYTVAVPSEKFEDFLSQSGTIGNVTSLNRSAENITSRYTDTEARIASLKVQEERLLAMMEESGDLESLIALEERLSEVTYEIESYQRDLNNWDRRVAYSTVSIDLWEVSVYTPTVPVTRTFGEKLGDAFSDGWKSFTRGVQGLILVLAELLPNLVLLAVIVLAVVFGVRVVRKRRAAKRAKTTKPEEKDGE